MNILATAAAVGSEPVFGLLLSHPSIDFGAKDGSKDNILKHAAVGGSEHIVRKVLALPGIDINAQGADGSTPLMWAASGGHEAVVRLLLAQPGIKVHIRNYQYTVYSETQHDRETLFRLQVSESRYPTIPECVRRNLAAGEIAVLPGVSAIDAAARAGHTSIVKLLLDDPTAAEVCDIRKRTPFMNAITEGHYDVVALFLDSHEIDLNHRDDDAKTAAIIAAEEGCMDILTLLLSRPNVDKDWLLAMAVRYGDEPMARWLLDSKFVTTKKELKRAFRSIRYTPPAKLDPIISCLTPYLDIKETTNAGHS